MVRERAESAPVEPFSNSGGRALSFRDARPERRDRTRSSGRAINDGTRATTTGDINQRTRKPGFPPLRKYSTSDHIDTSVLDPHADEEHDEYDEEDDDDDHTAERLAEEDEEEAEQEDDEGQRRQHRTSSTSQESSSIVTLAEGGESQHVGTTTATDNAEKRSGDRRQNGTTPLDPSKAEKGEAGLPAGMRRRTRTGTQTSVRSRKDPETREWKDNVSILQSIACSLPSRGGRRSLQCTLTRGLILTRVSFPLLS